MASTKFVLQYAQRATDGIELDTCILDIPKPTHLRIWCEFKKVRQIQVKFKFLGMTIVCMTMAWSETKILYKTMW